MCECGEPVYIKKAGQCRRCYMRDYARAHYVPTPRAKATEEDRKEKQRQYYEANRERLNEQRNERRRAQRAAGTYVDKTKAQRRSKRRAQERNAYSTGYIPNTDKLIEYLGNKCLACGTVDNLELDHVIPLSKGGSNDMNNYQWLCGDCNRKKAAHAKDHRINRVVTVSDDVTIVRFLAHRA